MKIAYICAYSEIASGGDSRVAWELARYMAGNTNEEIWMICPGDGYCIKRDNIEPRLQLQLIPSVPAMEGVSIFSPTLSNVSDLYRILDNLNPDIIHAHNFDPLAFVSQGWAITRKKPFVYTGHLLATQVNDWQDLNLGRAIESVVGMSLSAYTKAFYKDCTKIICLNNFAKNDFVKFTKEPSKMAVIPNGHIFEEGIKKTLDIEKAHEYKLLFAGYISERKNQLYLIKMLKELKTSKKVTLYIAGSFMNKEYEKIIGEALKTLPHNREVKLLGYVNHKDLLKMYEDVHYVVSAALAEVQSLSIIEALASGTPVIGLENTTISELINQKNGEALNPKTAPEIFAAKVDNFLSISNEKYKDLSENSRKSVEFLEYGNVAKKYLHFYNSLTSPKISLKKEDEVLKMIGRIFKWKPSKKTSGKRSGKLRYGITLGLVSTVVVAGVGALRTYNSFKKHRKK